MTEHIRLSVKKETSAQTKHAVSSTASGRKKGGPPAVTAKTTLQQGYYQNQSKKISQN
jgi:hypothetical protein